jgi:cation-transporting ATPase 13A2
MLVPFVVTIVGATLFSTYMLFDPSAWLSDFMQLTDMTWDFKTFILVLGVGYISLAWTTENYAFPRLAKWLGMAKEKVFKQKKTRKTYKIVAEEMRMLQLQ